MVTGDPGVNGAHVTQKQEKSTNTDRAMEVPAQGYLIQLHYVRHFNNFFLFSEF